MTIYTPLIGRFGNQVSQWAAVKWRAIQGGHGFSCPPWIGERIFEIEPASRPSSGDVVVGGYHQNSESACYPRKWLLDTLRLRPEIKSALDAFVPSSEILAHVRRGDYGPLNYPLVSVRSYRRACEQFGYNPADLKFVTEEEPLAHPDFTGELAFLPDFYRLMKARVLFRANSTFSFWAGALGEARVFSPCIKGKPGGVESDCDFSEGNHEKFADLPELTDLHLFREDERYQYRLSPMSSVIDIGGYNGDFAMQIEARYRANVDVYEPIKSFFTRIQEKVAGRKITAHNVAVGQAEGVMDFHIKGDMTGVFADGPTERVNVIDAATLEDSCLLKLNCEGGEYDILERLIETDRAKEHRNIQVQFHRVGPDYERRYAAIREALLKTHRITYDAPFVWINFELRT